MENTLARWRERFRSELASLYEPREADALFFIFMQALEGLDKPAYFMDPSRKIVSDKWGRVLQRLARGEPWQYITGRTEFDGLTLEVNPSVLIPRPETEELLQWIVEETAVPPARILDVGTGSGALALALRKRFPQAEVWAMDISAEALETARQNARRHGLDVKFWQGDMRQEDFPPGPWDLIVSNPPYVLPSERGHMHSNVKDFEPGMALFVPQDDPVVFYRHIVRYFISAVRPGSRLYFEINPLTKDRLAKLFEDHGVQARFRRDTAGRWRMAAVRVFPGSSF